MFEKWKSIPRLNKEVIITEKIDGTNAQVYILPADDVIFEMGAEDPFKQTHENVVAHTLGVKDGYAILAGSRKRYLTLEDDNFGFAKWVYDNSDDLFKLGPGRHYGEWWGLGIQRGYGLSERRLSMFNPKWADQGPDCVTSTPVLATLHGFNQGKIERVMDDLLTMGSAAAPGFMEPEGIVVFHTAANQMFKMTFDYDEGKWSAAA